MAAIGLTLLAGAGALLLTWQTGLAHYGRHAETAGFSSAAILFPYWLGVILRCWPRRSGPHRACALGISIGVFPLLFPAAILLTGLVAF